MEAPPLEKVPLAQASHVLALLACSATEAVPAGQGVGVEAPLGQKLPAGQAIAPCPSGQ
jgi:hypothetical protein